MANINDFKDKVDEDELARMTRELENNILGVKGEPSAHFGNKIQALRDRRESVENNLEAEAYTAEALRTVIDAQNASKPVDDTPSDVEGISQSELEALQNEARSTFAPAAKRDAPTEQAVKQPTFKQLNRSVPLHPVHIGVDALFKDIEKSEMDPSMGIRDFYNKTYSDHGDKRLRAKEHYLNLPISGDVAKARKGLSKFEELNGFNSSALESLNDGLISAMRDLHKEERKKEPHNALLAKRHATEEALFSFREVNENIKERIPAGAFAEIARSQETKKAAPEPEKAPDPLNMEDKPHALVNTSPEEQRRKNSLRDVLTSHIAYSEERWGRKLDHSKKRDLNYELQKFDLKMSSSKAPAPTLLQDVKQAQEIQKSKMQMKISRFR